ncbi:MAG: L-arabinose transport system permease protein AraQ [Phycisphaerales bacterium]|nr:L-arabinose transport system permease protein AraQ [Phycisphaerales bacterium]
MTPARTTAGKARRMLAAVLTHGLLLLLAALTLGPFLWMIVTSFKSLAEVDRTSSLPAVWQWRNYGQVFREIAFARYYFNSVLVALWVTFLQCVTSSLAAFAFARLKWRGRDSVFKLYLATMMIPGVVTMIPNYALMVKLHLLDSYAGLIVPAAFGAFGTFLLRQFMIGIHPALDESAAIDGAGPWTTYSQIILPLVKPGLATLAIFTFLGTYTSFFWPLVMIKSDHLRTLPIGMLYFDSVYGKQTNLLMAASVMNVVPLIIVFAIAQKQLVRGIQLGAVKG